LSLAALLAPRIVTDSPPATGRRASQRNGTILWVLAAAIAVSFAAERRIAAARQVRATADSLSKFASEKANGKSPDWVLWTMQREQIRLSDSNGLWSVLFVGDVTCKPCRDRQAALVEVLTARAKRGDRIALWTVNENIHVDDGLSTLAEIVPVRPVRMTNRSQIEALVGTRSVPVVLLVSPEGRIHRTSVGYYAGIDSALLAGR
jgi:hypothetical protein